MKQKAIVRETQGSYAIVEVSRSSMCDGCAKQNCADHNTCAAGAMFASAKTITARVKNPVGAAVGDIVWVESADGTVLTYAALVFLMPVAVCILAWYTASLLCAPVWGTYAAAGAGFVLSFMGIGLVEKKKKASEPDMEITGFVRDTGGGMTE